MLVRQIHAKIMDNVAAWLRLSFSVHVPMVLLERHVKYVNVLDNNLKSLRLKSLEVNCYSTSP